MRSLVTSIFLYACESWTLIAELQRRIQAMEMRCYRKILRISWKRPCYQRGSPCQNLASNKVTQTTVVWSYLPFIRSGQNHLARYGERGKKTRTEKKVGRQHQGKDRLGVLQVPEGSGEQGKLRKLVMKSSVVPQRPSRLKDGWWYWCWWTLRQPWRANQGETQVIKWRVWCTVQLMRHSIV